MKKLVTLTLTMMMGLSMLVGCSTKEDQLTIGIVQIVEHTSLDMIRESLVEELGTKGLVDGQNVKIDYQNAQGDQSNLNSICKKFVGDGVDVIVAIATPSAQAAAAATSEIPIIFSAVTDPVSAKLVTNLEKPEGNVTGTSDAIPVDEVFELCQELTPEVKTFGFLYTTSEVNSQSVVEEAKTLAADYGYDYEEVAITNTSELKQAAYSLAGKVDAIYTPIDNSIASAMTVLSEVGKETKVPVYVGADSMVMDGAYATVGINYEDLGRQTGDMVAEVLNGKAIRDLPVATLSEFQKVINKTTAKAIGAPETLEGALMVE
ncbi:MAG: ABC transporter substrate-binding protein [Zhenhengia sp.]|uniref:ABC transporter substrate-binding protein n=1 Tax=Zhenhengia sp. TaxID=2944208 RepID=UPI00291340C2|nr:ABC transporter substrate-binding protein [Clostridiales bacterium]MDU6974034.1 ABC transporter substrate-binding protein [Clostridiales bacterium]